MHQVVSPDEDAGQELGLLVGRAVLDQRRAHLTIGEPDRGDRCAGRDQLLADDQPVDRRLAAAAELDRPRHPDPTVGRHLLGELLREAVDPRIVVPAVPLDRLGRRPSGPARGGLSARVSRRSPSRASVDAIICPLSQGVPVGRASVDTSERQVDHHLHVHRRGAGAGHATRCSRSSKRSPERPTSRSRRGTSRSPDASWRRSPTASPTTSGSVTRSPNSATWR